MKINFFGDFRCLNVSHLSLDDNLKSKIKSADFNLLNFEAPIRLKQSKPIAKSGPRINNDPASPGWLLNEGFNLFSLANNHIFDFGVSSLRNTINQFPSNSTFGAGSWEEAYKPIVKSVDGISVAFLGLTQHEFGVLRDKAYKDQIEGAAWMLHPCIDELIIECKKKYNYLFVIPHCGMENEYYPMPEIRTIFRHFITMGADGVVASHPHTPQPYEIFYGKPIVYSMGNFCFDKLEDQTTPPPYWYWSLMIQLTITEKGICFSPFIIHYDEEKRLISMNNENENVNNHMSNLLSTFLDEDNYLIEVNKQCLKYRRQYVESVTSAGFYRLTPKNVLKQSVKWLIGRRYPYRYTSLINDLRCESHRWAILRILEQLK